MAIRHWHLLARIPRFTIIIGGGQAAIARHLALAGHIVFIIDSPNELGKLHIRERPGQRVFLVPVGKTDTLTDLFATAPPELQELAKDRPIPLGRGAGQLRGIGAYLAQALVASRAFNSTLHDEAIPHLKQQFGGRISEAVVELFFGMGGGMGSEGARVVGAYIAHELVITLGWLVDLEFNALGELAHAGLGDGIGPNSSAANAEYALLATTPPTNPRISISYVTGELLPCGYDAESRDIYVTERAMALTCRQVRGRLDMIRPNKAVHSKWGNCRIIEMNSFKRISGETVAAHLARQLLPVVDSLRHVVPDLSLIETLKFEVLSDPRPRESAASMISRANLMSSDEFEDAVCRPAATHMVAVQVETADGVPLDLTAARTTFGTPLATLEQTQQRLKWLKTCIVLLSRNAASIEAERQAYRTAFPKLLRKLRLMFKISTRQRTASPSSLKFLAWLLAIVLSNDTKLRWLADAIQEARDNLDAQALLQAKLAALQSAAVACLQEEEAINAALNILWNGLDDLRPKGEDARKPNYVTAGPLDDTWGDLLHLSPRDGKRELLELLPQTVRYVTLDGLAAIVEAASVRVDEVLRAMRSKHAITLGPPFGGMERVDSGIQILVLPPCDPALEAKLLEEFRKTESESLAFADFAPSVNAVGLEIFFVKTRDELFPTLYRRGLDTAAASVGYLSDRTVIQALGFGEPPPEEANDNELLDEEADDDERPDEEARGSDHV